VATGGAVASGLVAIVLPFELSLLFLAQATPVLIVESSWPCSSRRPSWRSSPPRRWVRRIRGARAYGLSPFLAMRPLANSARRRQAESGAGERRRGVAAGGVAVRSLHLGDGAAGDPVGPLWFGEAVGTPHAVASLLLIVWD
jgi:hypothetical protein